MNFMAVKPVKTTSLLYNKNLSSEVKASRGLQHFSENVFDPESILLPFLVNRKRPPDLWILNHSAVFTLYVYLNRLIYRQRICVNVKRPPDLWTLEHNAPALYVYVILLISRCRSLINVKRPPDHSNGSILRENYDF